MRIAPEPSSRRLPLLAGSTCSSTMPGAACGLSPRPSRATRSSSGRFQRMSGRRSWTSMSMARSAWPRRSCRSFSPKAVDASSTSRHPTRPWFGAGMHPTGHRRRPLKLQAASGPRMPQEPASASMCCCPAGPAIRTCFPAGRAGAVRMATSCRHKSWGHPSCGFCLTALRRQPVGA